MSKISTVRQLVDYAAEEYGEKDFCRYIRDNKVMKKSYAQFREDCLSICRYIRSVKRERIHIAFIGSTSYEYIACLTGMIFSGNVVVPFAPDISVDEAAELFEDADIELLFCEDAFNEKAREVQKRYPGLKSIVSLGNAQWFDDVFEKYKTGSFFNKLSAIQEFPDHCSLIIYTSGTTGRRKGVMLSNRNLAANTCYNEYALEATDVSFSVLPMHHVFCYACDVLKTLYDGGTLCLNGALVNLYDNLLRFEPTIMRIVPALCKSILTRIIITEKQNPSLTPREAAEKVVGRNFRRMIAGSAFLSAALIDGFEKYGITVRQGYGMSECSPRISTSDFTDVKNKYSNGKVLSVNEVRIVDDEIQVR
ncbi:MAG: AMP-binding protein, partial [Clostridia bacterium]|nr:AMP-binding protein [Clostridia bacterium]